MNRNEIVLEEERPKSTAHGPKITAMLMKTTPVLPSMWSVLLDTPVTVPQVYQCMVAVKLALAQRRSMRTVG